jgi:hypothetical protein
MNITRNQIKPEFGFKIGEVVQVFAGDLVEGGLENLRWRESVTWGAIMELFKEEDLFSDSEIVGIRVLTGPASIWIHAPDWAVAVFTSQLDYTVKWLVEDVLGFRDHENTYYSPTMVGFQKRPWWAEKKA